MTGPWLLLDNLLPPWQLTTKHDQGKLAQLHVVPPDEKLLLLVLLHQTLAEQLHHLCRKLKTHESILRLRDQYLVVMESFCHLFYLVYSLLNFYWM